MYQSWLSLFKSRRSLTSVGWQLFLALILLLETSGVSSMAEDYYNPDYDEVLNANNVGGLMLDNIENAREASPLTHYLEENMKDELNKRHLGSLAASGASGSRLGMRLSQNRVEEMAKRHLGSLAASSPSGSRLGLRLQSYGKDDAMGKRHLGSVAAVSGIRPRVIKSYSDLNSDVSNGANSPSVLLRNYLNLSEKESDLESNAESPNGAEFVDEQTLLKGKRFLGTMARGGWFPRQFRGFIEQPLGKRHIGAVARLGWIPYNKINRMEEGNEGSLKRNVQSLRKISLTRPEGN